MGKILIQNGAVVTLNEVGNDNAVFRATEEAKVHNLEAIILLAAGGRAGLPETFQPGRGNFGDTIGDRLGIPIEGKFSKCGF